MMMMNGRFFFKMQEKRAKNIFRFSFAYNLYVFPRIHVEFLIKIFSIIFPNNYTFHRIS